MEKSMKKSHIPSLCKRGCLSVNKGKCPSEKKQKFCFHGNQKSDVVVVGELSYHDHKQLSGFDGVWTPFSGEIGQFFKSKLKQAGLNSKNFSYVYATRCFVDKKDTPGKDITATLKACRVHIEKWIKEVNPKLLIVIGDFAMRQILKRSGITKSRGEWVYSKEFNCYVMPIYHPGYVTRNMAMESLYMQDLRHIKDFIRNGYDIPNDNNNTIYAQTDDVAHVCNNNKELILKNGIAIDTEGQGLDWASGKYITISYSFSFKPGTGYDVILYRECKKGEHDLVIEWERAPKGKKKKEPVKVYVKKDQHIIKKLEDADKILKHPKIKKYMMNGNFDLHTLNAVFKRELGREVSINNYAMDVQIGAHLLEENIYKMASLELLQQCFTDVRDNYNKKFGETYDKGDMLAIPENERSVYAAADTDITLQVAHSIRNELLKTKNRKLAHYLHKFCMPTIITLYHMEENGAYINPKELPKAKIEIGKLLEAERLKAIRAIPKKVKSVPDHIKKGIKLTRPDLIRDTLFSDKGFNQKPITLTKGGEPSTDSTVRTLLKDVVKSKKCLEFIDHYENWSMYNTLYTRYLTGFEKAIKPDGRIHTNFGLTTAVTGRVTSASPNLMNVPKRGKSAKPIRRQICAPKGYMLMAADESQSELRFIAAASMDETMLSVYKNDGDIHTETATGLVKGNWDDLPDDEKKVYRTRAKPLNFGVVYGMHANGFQKYAKQEYGVDLTDKEAEIAVNAFFKKYKRLKQWHRNSIEFCRKHGYVESIFGRRRRLPEINSKDNFLRGQAERLAINMPIQSASSDTVLMAANEIRRQGHDQKEFYPIMFIHDELVYVVINDEEKIMYYAKVLKHALENPPFERDFGIKFPISFKADVKIGPNLVDMDVIDL